MGEGSFSTSRKSLSRTSGNFLGRRAPNKMPPGPGPQPPPPLWVPGCVRLTKPRVTPSGSGPAHASPHRRGVELLPTLTFQRRTGKASRPLRTREPTESAQPQAPDTLPSQPGPGHVGPRLRTPYRLPWGQRRDPQCHGHDSFRPPGGDLGRGLRTWRTEVDRNQGPYMTCVKC